MTRTDRELLEAYARNGDEQAFAELVARHADAVFSAAIQSLRDAHAAEDALQATFAALARRAPSLAPDVSISGWLCRTAQLTARDIRKLQSRRRHHEHQAAALRACAASSNAEPNDPHPALPAALQALPPAERAVIDLRFHAGLSRADIARALDCPEGTVQTRVNRGVKRLREILRRGAVFAPVVMLVKFVRPLSLPLSMRCSAALKRLALGIARILYWSAAAALCACSVVSLAGAMGVFTRAASAPTSGATIVKAHRTASAPLPAIPVLSLAIPRNDAVRAFTERTAVLPRAQQSAVSADDVDIGLRLAVSPPAIVDDESIIGAAPGMVVDVKAVLAAPAPIIAKAKLRLDDCNLNVASLLAAGQRHSATNGSASHVNTELMYREWLAQSNGK
jgi:RNA polymerase sigma factor (sigma-70 family)